ncbi:TAXI family TRAP transporter solute-binding subunit [Pseudonocardia alaniniphila]|uniref:TAXI family TRAP transporter solute-binding subunit n=1 Tax=Pseudonocardia alaniniphila TaxID=75291 RepID=A0ABS9TPP8_9PSEU|nr:TAXI family TRAP transporter solute-binding subunit [Pseudonocardia alaniniphila]MCH6170506.1 TAXI family TRAP transporter solute-binding subunit [Pseudonocardia alaniniphila]
MPVTLSRRTLLRAAPLALAFVAAGCSGDGEPPVVVAAGEPGGFYVEFGELLVRQLQAAGISARVMETGGSVDNARHVEDGTAALGLALSDIAVAALRGEAPFAQVVALRAIGRVYENYMQVVVRAEDSIADVADLAGRQVSLGALGSGAAVFGDRLLAAAGITAPVTRRPLREAVTALDSGATDALLWSGGVPTPALDELAARRPIRLIPLVGLLPQLRARHGEVYGPVAVPAGVYGTSTRVPTVGVANLLVAGASLPDDVAGAVARTLVGSAPDLVPSAALGTQYLDQRSLIGTGDVPLHPGAAAAYRDLHG